MLAVVFAFSQENMINKEVIRRIIRSFVKLLAIFFAFSQENMISKEVALIIFLKIQFCDVSDLNFLF